MDFRLQKAIEILERTPGVLFQMLNGLSDEWTRVNEGGDTWSAYAVIGHLIHGEKTDWIPRMEIILSDDPDKRFTPFDRFAQFNKSEDIPLKDLLAEFKDLRFKNLEILQSGKISDDDLRRKGIHPVFGEVTLSQLLSTWVVHDLNHITQIARVLAKQYKEETGPWIEYLRILQS